MPAYIKYRKLGSYKYQLMEEYGFETEWVLPRAVETGGKWVIMSKTGRLTVKKGYAWDGPSGPTIDTKNFMRGSLVHDALYQLMGHGFLSESWRKKADELLRNICREDGMTWIRAQWVYQSVRTFGGIAIKPNPVITAP